MYSALSWRGAGEIAFRKHGVSDNAIRGYSQQREFDVCFAPAPAGKAGGVTFQAQTFAPGEFPDPALHIYAGKQFVELLQLLRQSGRRAL